MNRKEKERLKLWPRYDGDNERAAFASKEDYEFESGKLHLFLKDTYPKVFVKPYMPLAIGTCERLCKAHPEFHPDLIKDYLRKLTNNMYYLNTLGSAEPWSPRYTPSGKANGYIRIAHIMNALSRLAKLQEKKSPGSEIATLQKLREISIKTSSKARLKRAQKDEQAIRAKKNSKYVDQIVNMIRMEKSNRTIAASLGVSKAYVSKIRRLHNAGKLLESASLDVQPKEGRKILRLQR